MSYIKNWYVRNQDEITWFLIGWLGFALVLNIVNGSWGWAIANAFFIWVNFKLRKVRL